MMSASMRYRALIVVLVGIGATTGARANTEMSIQVREGELRNRASFLGSVVAVVQYGDRVQVERNQGPWLYVAVDEAEGWIHQSALTSKRIEMQASDRALSGAATEDELALAGRGFNAQVEGEFKAQNEEVDFAWIDYMEQLRMSAPQLRQFLREGGVVPVEEGR